MLTSPERYRTDVLQDEGELEWLIAILRREKVKSYLEIGSHFGGSLWRITNALPLGSRVLAVDMPLATETAPHLNACVRTLQLRGYDANVIYGDSRAADTINAVAARGPFDVCLIDGDHSFAGVRSDWLGYGPLCRIVAFHDIAWKREPAWQGDRIEVPQFWLSIKDGFRHEECILNPQRKDNGIGVLWC